jgi:hypothetical protein
MIEMLSRAIAAATVGTTVLFSMPLYAQPIAGQTPETTVSLHHQMQYQMMKEMTQQMQQMREQMSREQLSSEESRKLSEQMS